MSVLWLNSGNTMKFSLSPWEIPRDLPSGFASGSGYISLYIPPLVTIQIQYLECPKYAQHSQFYDWEGYPLLVWLGSAIKAVYQKNLLKNWTNYPTVTLSVEQPLALPSSAKYQPELEWYHTPISRLSPISSMHFPSTVVFAEKDKLLQSLIRLNLNPQALSLKF